MVSNWDDLPSRSARVSELAQITHNCWEWAGLCFIGHKVEEVMLYAGWEYRTPFAVALPRKRGMALET